MGKLTLIADNANPEKPKSKIRTAHKVERHCPACGCSTWVWVMQGPADILEGIKQVKKRGCWNCKHVW